MTTHEDHPPKRPRGRPRAEPGQGRDQNIDIRATAAEKAKFDAVGGPKWFRAALKRAKVPSQP